MGNLAGLGRTNLIRHQSDNCNCVTIERYKFNFVALVSAMHEHNSANVTDAQAIFRQVAGKNYVFQFFNRIHFFRRSGYAVTKRGIRSPNSINHTERILATVSSGMDINPSMTKRTPSGELTWRETSCSSACCRNASANSSHCSVVNPRAKKKLALLLPER